MITSELVYRGSLNQLEEVVSRLAGTKILLVTGKSSFENSPCRGKIEAALKNFSVLRHCDFDINPNDTDLLKGADVINTFEPDILIGVGGGSVMDTAKLLSVMSKDRDTNQKIIKGHAEILYRKRKLILIPTTSGSGSEATHFAVAYVNKRKFSIASEYLLPDVAIVDSELTETMPRELTLITLFDAYCQAIESYWAVGATAESRQYASESLGIINEIFNCLIDEPEDFSRERMAKASFLSGKAINISKTTGPHAVSYALTQYFDIPHGLAVMLTLGAFFKHNTNYSYEDLNNLVEPNQYRNTIETLCQLINPENPAKAINRPGEMMKSAGIGAQLRDYGINDTSDIDIIADSVNYERLNNNPIKINSEGIISLIKSVY